MPNSPPFIEGGMKIPKNWVGGEPIILKSYQGKTGGQRENTKFVGVIGFFRFSLENLFLKVWSQVISYRPASFLS